MNISDSIIKIEYYPDSKDYSYHFLVTVFSEKTLNFTPIKYEGYLEIMLKIMNSIIFILFLPLFICLFLLLYIFSFKCF